MTSRPSKRQKLDDGAPRSSPAPSKTPVTYGKGSKSSPAINTNGATNASSDAKSEWFAAKAHAARERRKLRPTAQEKKEEEMDVYDDIEGAHRGGRPYIQRGSTDARKSRQKPALNPLRNQKEVAESPQKASKSTDLGLFKKLGKGKEDESGETSQSRGDTASIGRAQRSTARTGSQGKGWIASTGPPKKTFEDEMREIQQHARQETQDGDSDDELVQQDDPKRTSARRPAKKAASVTSSAAATKTKKQTLDRRKKAASREASLEIPESDDAERVVIDITSGSSAPESENEKPAPAQRLTTPKKGAAKPTRNAVASAKISFQDDQLQCLRNIALAKATRKRPISLTNLDDEYAKVANVIVQTITAGESNSMLLIGPRGSGKTAMVDQIVREQSKTHGDDFHVVRLNGFIHTDDKIALRDIWRQLGKEMEIDEDEAVSKNYADTMTRLLALLSHPAENGIETEQVTKSVIFILGEFELFAGHPRQTLLYNLFDIAQSRKAPIAVVGLTTRIDVVESLEKRVKSRFSHRYVYLSLPKSLTAFEQICRPAIAIQPDELTDDEKKTIGQARGSSGSLVKASESEKEIKALANWNTVVNDLFASETCKNFLERLFYATKSLPEFLTTLTLALSTLPTTSQTTTSVLEHFSTSISNSAALQAPDSKLSLLPSLGTLQLALLVCAARLTNIYNTEIITFPLVYEEYKALASKAKLQATAAGGIATAKVWGKRVGRGAWEGLSDVGLVMQDGTAGAGRVDVGLEELRDCGVDLGGWQKWCKEI
ncbi:hypothetical protein CERZMDRAFT_122646 [Cercospora zeae-maydis SCOH1-5]|uniref:Uncharacterized protein n=1 Tax=Cercospora zeae-maydis SCOH1-5 TaxID=717836 RepID=A0A6A6F300_9PEZI|nr:hypothetical protein CERZMDRAFT_122646 [Cercospora zeae-maydis SCOH1-5]